MRQIGQFAVGGHFVDRRLNRAGGVQFVIRLIVRGDHVGQMDGLRCFGRRLGVARFGMGGLHIHVFAGQTDRIRCKDHPVGRFFNPAGGLHLVHRQPLMRRRRAARIVRLHPHRPFKRAHDRHFGHVAHGQFIAPERQSDHQPDRQKRADPIGRNRDHSRLIFVLIVTVIPLVCLL